MPLQTTAPREHHGFRAGDEGSHFSHTSTFAGLGARSAATAAGAASFPEKRAAVHSLTGAGLGGE